MSDQSLTGVTTRSLDTSQDIARAGAISTRSGLARMYADQFRTSRSSLRRGAVVRETTGPSVPAAPGDVTQTQDVSVPGSFQDVIDAAGDFRGDSQSANQTINPGMGGGGYGRGLNYGAGMSGQGDGGSPGYGPNPGMQHVGPTDTSEPPPVENINREGDGCAVVVNNQTGAIETRGNCGPDLSNVPNDAEGMSRDKKYFYKTSPYDGNGGKGTLYVLYRADTGERAQKSIAVTANKKVIARSYTDFYWGNGAGQWPWWNQEFNLGFHHP
jgi:hypothetical protein